MAMIKRNGHARRGQLPSKATAQEPLGCRHHWVIDTPNGPTSQGVCKLCGAQQQFQNSIPTNEWYHRETAAFPALSLVPPNETE